MAQATANYDSNSLSFLIEPEGRVSRRLRCRDCPRDLLGTTVDDLCPQCACPVAESIRSRLAEAHVDGQGRILADRPCRRCGYDLYGVALDGACPECGAAARMSAYGDGFQYCDPRWLERLRWGARWVSAGVFTIVAGWFVVNAVHPGISGVALFAIGILLQAIGVWLLSSTERAGAGAHHLTWMRWLARIGCLSAALLGVGMMAVAWPAIRVGSPWISVGGLLFCGSLLIGAITHLELVESLLRRASPSHDSRQRRALRRAVTSIWAVTFLFALLQATFNWLPGINWGAIPICFASPMSVLMLLIWWYWHAMLDEVLRPAMDEARSHWPTTNLLGDRSM